MEINIKLPAAAVLALENIAHELKELRLGLCPPLRAGKPKSIQVDQPSQVRYPDNTKIDYWRVDPPVERREDRE